MQNVSKVTCLIWIKYKKTLVQVSNSKTKHDSFIHLYY